MIRRRDFIKLLGGAATAWPLAARAQQASGLRRIGILLNTEKEDPEGQLRLVAFTDVLKNFGLLDGRDIRLEVRWTAGQPARIEQQAAELLALEPDAVLAWGAFAVRSVQKRSATVPIVFVQITDPVRAGFVSSLARPGGNVTGFTQFEYAIGGKWLELLHEIAPRTASVVVAWDATNAAGSGQLQMVKNAALSAIEVIPVDVRDLGEVERAVGSVASGGKGGLIVPGSSFASAHRQQLTALAARHQLPAIYPYGHFVTDGGLMSYGPDTVDQFRQAAGYVQRILKGEKPSDLPVQAPTKFELAINLKTAKALGITVPPTLLARADEVIE